MPTSKLVVTTRKMDHDDLTDLLPEMPDVVSRILLQSMESQHRERLESVLAYPEDSAGADPALAGGIRLTTVTDIVGFFSFLGLASIMLI